MPKPYEMLRGNVRTTRDMLSSALLNYTKGDEDFADEISQVIKHLEIAERYLDAEITGFRPSGAPLTDEALAAIKERHAQSDKANKYPVVQAYQIRSKSAADVPALISALEEARAKLAAGETIIHDDESNERFEIAFQHRFEEDGSVARSDARAMFDAGQRAMALRSLRPRHPGGYTMTNNDERQGYDRAVLGRAYDTESRSAEPTSEEIRVGDLIVWDGIERDGAEKAVVVVADPGAYTAIPFSMTKPATLYRVLHKWGVRRVGRVGEPAALAPTGTEVTQGEDARDLYECACGHEVSRHHRGRGRCSGAQCRCRGIHAAALAHPEAPKKIAREESVRGSEWPILGRRRQQRSCRGKRARQLQHSFDAGFHAAWTYLSGVAQAGSRTPKCTCYTASGPDPNMTHVSPCPFSQAE